LFLIKNTTPYLAKLGREIKNGTLRMIKRPEIGQKTNESNKSLSRRDVLAFRFTRVKGKHGRTLASKRSSEADYVMSLKRI
jgi:hypothetical protein